LNILGDIFTIFVSLVLPIFAAVWLAVKRKGYLVPVLLGAATFTLFQILTRIPIVAVVLPKTMWFTMLSQTHPFLYALFMGGTAALFEEGGRWIVMKRFMRRKHRVADGIAFGVGHGGIEAVFFAGIGTLVQLIINGASETPSLTFAGGVERISAMTAHIAWSVMVLKSVSEKKPVWLLVAFLLHAAVDAAVVVLGTAGVSVLLIETVIGAFALVMLRYIIFEYNKAKGGKPIEKA
jgi:uncharacterized membrane protein YhfC